MASAMSFGSGIAIRNVTMERMSVQRPLNEDSVTVGAEAQSQMSSTSDVVRQMQHVARSQRNSRLDSKPRKAGLLKESVG